MMMKKRCDKIIFWISCACLCLILAYGYGFVTAKFKFFPNHQFVVAFQAAAAKYGLAVAQFVFSNKHDKYPFIWFPTNETTSGVVLHEKGHISPGLTFFCDGSTSALLIDMNGNVFHQWQKGLYEVWPRPEHVTPYLPAFFDQEEMIC